METIELKVAGMTCASCANSVSKALKRVAGVQDVHVDLARGAASVTGDQTAQKTPELIAALAAAGYEASADSSPGIAAGAGASHAPPLPFKGMRLLLPLIDAMDARTNSQGIAAAPLGLFAAYWATCCGGPSRPAKR